MAKKRGFSRLRQALLFYVLLMVAASAWLARERSTDWNNTLWVAVFPINGDRSERAATYIQSLQAGDFDPVESFFQSELRRYGLTLEQPVHIDLRAELDERPPPLPKADSVLSIMRWSLVMRYWAWQMERRHEGVTPDIKLFVVYYDPQTHETLPHSVGVQKGLFGVVNAYATRSQRGSNQVVLAHELLHTLGATDKYNLSSGLPLYPVGYAEPDAEPRYPQRNAEIMGGRIPVDSSTAEMPDALTRTRVGRTTAVEIRWLSP
jgi:hypothetical protein